ncbi:MAG: hypothetical protein RL132_1522 [Pseudomonadota bacterium]
MHLGRTTLSKFLIQELDGSADARDLAALLIDVASAVKVISAMTAKGALAGILGSLETENIQGEVQKKLDVLSNTAFVNTFTLGGLIAGLASEEMDDPIALSEEKRGPFLAIFDPLDGSSNIDVNVSVGSIFSVLRAPKGRRVVMADYLRPGREQLAAGYALYGPSTMFVLTVGKGTHGFTLDREVDNFILTHADIQVPADTSEFAINTSNERFWEPPVLRYVAECKAGKTDVRGRDFNMRWIASMAAEIHRILMRGGIYPMGLVVEQAGGLASTGRSRILEVQPELIHQRIPVIMGSRNEVERIERYHEEFDTGTDQTYSSPLFKERSLFQ